MENMSESLVKKKNQQVAAPNLPEMVMSNDRQVKMNYHFLKKQITKTPIVPMQQDTFERILHKVEDTYQNNKTMNRVVETVFEDARNMYNEAMQQTVTRNVLIAPDVKGLEDEQIATKSKDVE